MQRVFALILGLAISASSSAETSLPSTSLTLQQARVLMLEKNRELLAARRMVEGLQADTISAGQRPNPMLSVNASSLRLDGPNGNLLRAERLDVVARVDQLIERGGKRELRSAVAERAVEAGRLDLADLQRQQAVTLAGAYYDLLLAQEKERINRETTDLFDKTLQAAEFRLQAGDISAADVSRIRVDALRAHNDLRLANADREKAQTVLAYLIGQESAAGSLLAADDFPQIVVPTAPALDTLLENRPDVRAAQARIAQAEKQRDLARSQKVRDVTVGVELEHAPGSNAATAIGGGFSIPLFTNYEYQGEIAHAEVNMTAAMEDLERVRAQAISEVDKARSDLLAAADRATRFDQSVLSEAEKSADAAAFAYQHGALAVMDLLDVRRTLRALQLESAATHADFAKAEAAWHAAINTEIH